MSTIAWPTGLSKGPTRLEWGLRANTQSFTSPLNGETETLELPGARWMCRLTMPPFKGTLALNDQGIMAAYIMKLRGQANRAALYNFKRSTPLGTINTTGVTVNGAVSAGATAVTFAGAGNAKTLQTGDFFSVAGELKMVVDGPYTSTSGGAMSNVAFEPPVRVAWSNGAAVTLDKPTALFILESSEAGWRSSVGDVTEFDLAFVEAFA